MKLPPSAQKASSNAKALFAANVRLCPDTFPLSVRWLAQLWVPETSKLPFQLRGSSYPSGLRPLEADFWLEVDPCTARLRRELQIKEALLDQDAEFFNTAFAAEGGEATLPAQWEVLQMVLASLRHHSGYKFTFKSSDAGNLPDDEAAKFVESVETVCTGRCHRIDKWSGAPLALACLLCQEDFIILRSEQGRPESRYVFVAGAACFAFSEVGLHGERGFMRLGEPLDFIHSKVPGFRENMLQNLARVFDNLRPESPVYRTNWALAPSGTLSPFEKELEAMGRIASPSGTKLHDPSCAVVRHSFSRAAATEGVIYSAKGVEPSKLWLKVEHQVLHKLHASSGGTHVLFTVRTYADRLGDLRSGGDVANRAMLMLGRAIDDLTDEQLEYRDLGDFQHRSSLQAFLHGES